MLWAYLRHTSYYSTDTDILLMQLRQGILCSAVLMHCRQLFGGLYKYYADKYYWWGVVINARKFLVLLPLLLPLDMMWEAVFADTVRLEILCFDFQDSFYIHLLVLSVQSIPSGVCKFSSVCGKHITGKRVPPCCRLTSSVSDTVLCNINFDLRYYGCGSGYFGNCIHYYHNYCGYGNFLGYLYGELDHSIALI